MNDAISNVVIPPNFDQLTSDRLLTFVVIMAHQLSQSDRAPNEGLTARAEAALTHPATLLALATLCWSTT